MKHLPLTIKALLFHFLFFFIFTLQAQPPTGYYNGTDGLIGTALQSKLHDIIKNHTSLTYSGLWNAFYTTDDRPDGKVWDMYSDIPSGNPPYLYTFGSNQCGNYNSEGDCYNREHSWPASWFNDKYPMYTDLFQICPTDGYVNNRRSNYPYGVVGSTTWSSMNGSKLGSNTYPGYSGTVFEPINAYKGDFARNYFYMGTRYLGEDAGWASNGMVTGSQLKTWAANMLLEWHTNDPVSLKETDRNNAVYTFQHNRNPYIDHPEFAVRIWGDPTAIPEITRPLMIAYYNNQSQSIVIGPFEENTKAIIMVSDMSGRKINFESTYTSGSININASSLPNGIYIVSIIDKHFVYGLKTAKF
ncbi:MAG: endonuclease [Bacteroidales bacterium]|nr:endonuclease [Bacteroidales bacterium]